ncbi:MAG: Murein hydrolase activator EnvC [Flavobacterium sp. SCGC AAA160-P02]|nr:MAG: Murein hydrolase activator EnvC [Flavobacterium sp. SCGC AAA160-P02]|tara:strand:- start:437 stop:1654 length:1218 start_codon:yes stop_codon:yes gene_type:complete
MIQKTSNISFFLFLFLMFSMSAQKNSRKQLEVERNRIKKEIKLVNKLLFETKKKEKNILEDLKDLNQKITIREQLITTINLELTSLSYEINTYEKQIEKLTEKLRVLKDDYAAMIYKSYKSKSQQSRTLFLFSSKSFYQAYKRLKYMSQYASFRKKQGEEVSILTKKLLKLKDSLAYQKQLKDTLLSNEQQQQLKIIDEKEDQQAFISQIKKKEKKYKKELRQKQQKEKRISERIDKLIKEAIAKSNAMKGAKKSKGFALTPEAKALAIKFEQNKGKLPWPVESGLVIRRFGKQPHPVYPGNYINSTGIHIATKKGTNAEAIFNGEVLAIQTQSEGKKSILLRHGNYISVYNNLESVFVGVNEKVKTGQALGKIFTDRITGKTKLIFVLSKNTTRLNPISWILKK